MVLGVGRTLRSVGKCWEVGLHGVGLVVLGTLGSVGKCGIVGLHGVGVVVLGTLGSVGKCGIVELHGVDVFLGALGSVGKFNVFRHFNWGVTTTSFLFLVVVTIYYNWVLLNSIFKVGWIL